MDDPFSIAGVGYERHKYPLQEDFCFKARAYCHALLPHVETIMQALEGRESMLIVPANV